MNAYIGFIGAGNMGGAIASSVCRAGYADKVILCDKDSEKAKTLADKLACFCGDTEKVIAKCDVVFLGVKPQFLADTVESLIPLLKARKEYPLFVSMAAGVSLEKLGALLGEDVPVIRIMPNTPVSVGEGMILWCANKNTKKDNNN